jgi:hypothetical protein
MSSVSSVAAPPHHAPAAQGRSREGQDGGRGIEEDLVSATLCVLPQVRAAHRPLQQHSASHGIARHRTASHGIARQHRSATASADAIGERDARVVREVKAAMTLTKWKDIREYIVREPVDGGHSSSAAAEALGIPARHPPAGAVRALLQVAPRAAARTCPGTPPGPPRAHVLGDHSPGRRALRRAGPGSPPGPRREHTHASWQGGSLVLHRPRSTGPPLDQVRRASPSSARGSWPSCLRPALRLPRGAESSSTGGVRGRTVRGSERDRGPYRTSAAPRAVQRPRAPYDAAVRLRECSDLYRARYAPFASRPRGERGSRVRAGRFLGDAGRGR